MAICHAAYEISEGYYSNEWKGIPNYISYLIKPMVKNEEWNQLEYAEVINNDALPELGSRAFRNIYVVQPLVQSINNDKDNKIMNLCMLDWTDVQNGYYKYQVYMRENMINVKMIFREFLYAEVVFEKKLS